MMKLTVTILFSLIATVSLSAQVTFGNKTIINDGWSFSLDGGRPQTVDLPHDWSIKGEPSASLGSCTGYLPGGVGTYEKTIFIDTTQKGQKQYLYFDGVYCCSSVYVNGKLCGYRPNGYVAFAYDITPYVKYGKDNDIKVTVDHSEYTDSRYYTGSGIYRDVYLVTCGQVHIDNWGVYVTTPEVSAKEAVVNVKTKVVNDGKKVVNLEVVQVLYGRGGKDTIGKTSSSISVLPGSATDCEQEIKVKNPSLWSPKSPKLYSVETAIYQDGKLIDATSTNTGIRSLRYDPNEGFFLNGEYTKIKGVCLHHDAGSLGAIVPYAVLKNRLYTLKTIGCNAIRMSHNPQAEMIYDLCDEMGFMVMDEAFDEWMSPKRKWVEGWNKGKNPSLQGYAKYFDEWCERDARDMVLRSRNHPSIIMWSIGNEIDYPNDPFTHPILDYEGINQKTTPGYKPERQNVEILGPAAEKLAKAVRDADATRPVTAALAGVVMSNYTGYPGALDIVGYNYTEYRYEKDHADYPERVLYGSENRHDYPAWKSVLDNRNILGQFLWTGFDYLGEARVWPSRGSQAGLLDYCGRIKPRGWYRKTLWSDEPSIYVGTKLSSSVGNTPGCYDWTSNWNYSTGDTICVAVMSNCESTVLSVNGRKIESEPEYKENCNAYCWYVPYEPGTVTCEGVTADGKTASYSFETVGKAEKYKTNARRTVLDGYKDVTQLDVDLQDAQGRTVTDNGVTVKFNVAGDVELISLENGDPQFHCRYDGTEVPSYNGRAIAYIRSTKESGKGSVTISSLGKDKTINFDVIGRDEQIRVDTLATAFDVYRRDPDLKIYYIYPDRKIGKNELLPTVVFYYGGGWVGGNIQAFAAQAYELAGKGLAVALVEYRTWNRNHTKPYACIEDAKSAMRYIRANAKRLHMDPDRLCTSGGSAGGHLAAAVAFCPGFDAPDDDISISTVPNAMVLYNPVFNNAPEPEGYGYTRIADRFPDFSPYHNIKAPAPPTLIMVGTEDHLIPVSTVENFEKKMKEVGARCETRFYEGQGHGFFNSNKKPKKAGEPYCYRVTLDEHIAFLQSLGWIK